LRAIRFEQRFHFQIEPRTLELLYEAREMLSQVSGSRLRHEFDLIMSEPSPMDILQRASYLDVLGSIHRDLVWNPSWKESLQTMFSSTLPQTWNLPARLGTLPVRTVLGYLIWLGHFSRDCASRIANHLRFTSQMASALQFVCLFREKMDNLAHLSPGQFSNHMEKVPLISLAAVYFLSDCDQTRQTINKYVISWRGMKIFTRGEDLQRAGIPVGPKYKEIISQLRNAWLEGIVKSREEEIALLDRLIKSP